MLIEALAKVLAWPVPRACARPYPSSTSHGPLFRPYWGSSAWHGRPALKKMMCISRV